MFKRFFGGERRANRAIVDALYAEIVAAARQPALYTAGKAPDTPLGRFEMMALHAFLVLDRLRDQPAPAGEVAQDLTDAFFADLENSLRELGIGDLGVPKRMKKLARMFYGRTLSYRGALESRDAQRLAEALARNVRPGEAADGAAEAMAAYATEAERALGAQDLAALLAGRIAFPSAAVVMEPVA